jgi:2-hydroxy-3-keto-5-methylthiopentenyl-1-phosphate phosphatase
LLSAIDDDDEFFNDEMAAVDLYESPVEYPLDVVVVVIGDKVPDVDSLKASFILLVCNTDRCCC